MKKKQDERPRFWEVKKLVEEVYFGIEAESREEAIERASGPHSRRIVEETASREGNSEEEVQ